MGVVSSSSAVLLLALASGYNFESASQFMAYLGLLPYKMKSGAPLKDRAHTFNISKPEYEIAMYMPALVAYAKICILIL